MEVSIVEDTMGVAWNQRVRIPKATWTSPILGRRYTRQTFSCVAFFMKDNVKVKVPNKTPKTLIPLDGVVN
jgi:hypothetical protein